MREAAEQLSRALGQIATLPGTAALRGEQIKLKVALANALAHLKGYAAPETRTSLHRARSLIERAGGARRASRRSVAAVETNDQPKDGRTSGYDAEIAEAICERARQRLKPQGHLCRSRDAGQSHGIPLARQQSGISPAVVDRDRSCSLQLMFPRFGIPT